MRGILARVVACPSNKAQIDQGSNQIHGVATAKMAASSAGVSILVKALPISQSPPLFGTAWTTRSTFKRHELRTGSVAAQ